MTKELKTVEDILELIQDMLEFTKDPALQVHAKSLLGPRTRGSTTKYGLERLAKSRTLLDMTASVVSSGMGMEGCRYFGVYADELFPKKGVMGYEAACTKYGADQIKRREGPHGPELYLDQEEAAAQMIEVSNITIIVGEHPGFGLAVFTWHPGLPSGVYKGEEPPAPNTAVKLHNG